MRTQSEDWRQAARAAPGVGLVGCICRGGKGRKYGCLCRRMAWWRVGVKMVDGNSVLNLGYGPLL